MKVRASMASTLISRFDDLSCSDVLGNYKQFEVIEVIGFRDKSQIPTNVLTLIVATEAEDTKVPEGFINGQNRIKLSGLPNWTFGIYRRWFSLDQVRRCLERFTSSKQWEIDEGKPVTHGPLVLNPVQFAPPDSTGKVPLNRVLKNNFWTGSHVLELVDTSKPKLDDLLQSPKHLLQLSEKVQKFIPLAIGALSDRLGNVLFQFPVEVLRCQFFKSKEDNSFSIEVAWHPDQPERPMIAQMEILDDQSIVSFGTVEITKSGIHSVMSDPGYGSFRGTLWDVKNKILLAATDQVSLIRKINVNMGMISPEPRIFKYRNDEQRVSVQVHNLLRAPLDKGGSNSHEQTWARLYSEEKTALAAQKKLIQYKEPFTSKAHADALEDVRWLIRRHGHNGTWLWDPYLSAEDVLGTLFFSPHGHSDLRALTALEQVADGNAPSPDEQVNSRREQIRQSYTHTLNGCAGNNCTALKLEFRVSVTTKFHDRFLIFPHPTEEPLVWSLGTSVNSLGKSHHILQQVQNGRLVFDAFDEIWNSSGDAKHIIWKI